MFEDIFSHFASCPRPRKSRVLKKTEDSNSRHRNAEQKGSRQFRESQQVHSPKVRAESVLALTERPGCVISWIRCDHQMTCKSASALDCRHSLSVLGVPLKTFFLITVLWQRILNCSVHLWWRLILSGSRCWNSADAETIWVSSLPRTHPMSSPVRKRGRWFHQGHIERDLHLGQCVPFGRGN